jgi:hypothetical protein
VSLSVFSNSSVAATFTIKVCMLMMAACDDITALQVKLTSEHGDVILEQSFSEAFVAGANQHTLALAANGVCVCVWMCVYVSGPYFH